MSTTSDDSIREARPETESPPPILPYTLDDSLIAATRADGQPRVRIYRVLDPMVVLGRGSDPEVELRLENCRADGVTVRKRHGGGCAVVLDPGNVIVSVAVAQAGLGGFRATFDALTRWLIAGLGELGFPDVTSDGVSDLVQHDRKISGSCVYRSLGLVFYSATLLVDPDPDLVERYLSHPPREPAYRRDRAHRDFMGRLESPTTAYTSETLEAAARAHLTVESLPSFPQ